MIPFQTSPHPTLPSRNSWELFLPIVFNVRLSEACHMSYGMLFFQPVWSTLLLTLIFTLVDRVFGSMAFLVVSSALPPGLFTAMRLVWFGLVSSLTFVWLSISFSNKALILAAVLFFTAIRYLGHCSWMWSSILFHLQANQQYRRMVPTLSPPRSLPFLENHPCSASRCHRSHDTGSGLCAQDSLPTWSATSPSYCYQAWAWWSSR